MAPQKTAEVEVLGFNPLVKEKFSQRQAQYQQTLAAARRVRLFPRRKNCDQARSLKERALIVNSERVAIIRHCFSSHSISGLSRISVMG